MKDYFTSMAIVFKVIFSVSKVQQQSYELDDSPPTYRQIMGSPPAYHTLKIPNLINKENTDIAIHF